jgi:hypothetical protein
MMDNSRRLPNQVSLRLEQLERRDCPASLTSTLVNDVAFQSQAVAQVIKDVNAGKLTPGFVVDVVTAGLATEKLFLDVQQLTHTRLSKLTGPLQQLQIDLVQGYLAGLAGNISGAQQLLVAQLSDLTQVFNALAGPNVHKAKFQADVGVFIQDSIALAAAASSQNTTAVAAALALEESALLAVIQDLANGAATP